MEKKKINIELNVNEDMAYFINIYAQRNKISISKATKILINKGIQLNAKNLKEALILGIKSDKKLVNIISQIHFGEKISQEKIPTVSEALEGLKENVELTRNDKLIEEVKSMYRKEEN